MFIRQVLQDFYGFVGFYVSVCLFVCLLQSYSQVMPAKIKNVKMTFVEFDIYYRMAPLQKLYYMTLIYFFMVKKK